MKLRPQRLARGLGVVQSQGDPVFAVCHWPAANRCEPTLNRDVNRRRERANRQRKQHEERGAPAGERSARPGFSGHWRHFILLQFDEAYIIRVVTEKIWRQASDP